MMTLWALAETVANAANAATTNAIDVLSRNFILFLPVDEPSRVNVGCQVSATIPRWLLTAVQI